MKTLILLLLSALVLAGCGTTTDYAQYSKAQTDIATARHNAEAAKYQAMADIAASGTESAKVAAVVALALGTQGNAAQTPLQAPQANEALQWASILVPGLTQALGIAANMRVGVTQSNNATALGISTNGTMQGIAGLIQAAPTITNTDRHDVYTPAPVVVNTPTPLVPVVINPPVISPPVVITPVVQITPVFVP